MRPRRPFHPAFTLAELLIVLAILGVIATFSVPKILYGSRTQEWNAKAKEAAAAISEAYANYRLENTVSASTKATDILAYINAVGPYTGANINAHPGFISTPCTGDNTCRQLHNGAVILVHNINTFGGTTPNHAVWFYVDPDGKFTDGATTPENGSVVFFLYANGGLRNYGSALSPTYYAFGSTVYTAVPVPSADPTWFKWN